MRYFLFSGDTFYPLGGWRDFCGAFRSLQEANEAFDEQGQVGNDWAHIIDIQTMEMVREGTNLTKL